MKNWLILILILNLVLSTTLIGEEITLRTGEVVSFTKILKIEPDGLKLAYPDGIKKIRIEDMKEADQKKYDLKLDQAKAFREENLAAMKAADQAGLEEEAKTKQENDEAKAKAAKVPKIISAEQMKAVWIKNLPAPGTLDRDYQAKLRTYNAMIDGIRTGGFDNLAQERVNS